MSKSSNLKEKKLRKCWRGIIRRTTNPSDISYHRYGGRGVGVCEGWMCFENFKKDMFSSFEIGLTIERIDNNKGYSFSNCKWATQSEQNKNKSSCIKFNGETAKDASFRLGGNHSLVSRRMRAGWDLEDAFTVKPIQRDQFNKVYFIRK